MANDTRTASYDIFHRHTNLPGSAKLDLWDSLPKQDLLPLTRWQRLREWWRGR